MIKAIIWDMDGTLIESEGLHVRAEADTLLEYGVDISTVDSNEFMGLKLRHYFEEIGKKFGKKLPVDEIIKKHSQTLRGYYSNKFPEVPHASEVVRKLSKRYPTALATSAHRRFADLCLVRMDIEDCFKFVIGGNEVERAKPDPEIYEIAARELGVEPSEALVVEDSHHGIHAGKAAGATVIARQGPHNKGQDLSEADHIITDLTEIEVYLDKQIT